MTLCSQWGGGDCTRPFTSSSGQFKTLPVIGGNVVLRKGGSGWAHFASGGESAALGTALPSRFDGLLDLADIGPWGALGDVLQGCGLRPSVSLSMGLDGCVLGSESV